MLEPLLPSPPLLTMVMALTLLIGFLELSAMPVILFYWLVPGSLDKRDFELTSSADYALIVVAIAIAGGVGGRNRASTVDQVRVSTAVLPRGTSHGVPMCLITFLVVILAK